MMNTTTNTRRSPQKFISINSFPSVSELNDKDNNTKKQMNSNDKERHTTIKISSFPFKIIRNTLNEKQFKVVRPLIKTRCPFQSTRENRIISLGNPQFKATSFVMPEIYTKELRNYNLVTKTRNTSKKGNIIFCKSIGRFTLNPNNSYSTSSNIKSVFFESNREILLTHLLLAQNNQTINSILQKGINTPLDIEDISNCVTKYFTNIDKLYDISYNYRCAEIKKSQCLSAIFSIEKINTVYATIFKIQIILYTIIQLALKHLSSEEVIYLFSFDLKEILTKLVYPLNLIYGHYLMVPNELLQKYAESYGFGQSMLDDLISFYKKFRIKSPKAGLLVLTINKCTDISLRNLREYINNTMKYSKLKLFHSTIDSMIDMIKIKCDKSLAKLSIACVIYYEYQKNLNDYYNGKDSEINQENDSLICKEESFESYYLPPINFSFTYTLVVDLDETLVHYIQCNNEGTYFIRPYCFDFLEELYNQFELIVFTAGTKDV